MASSFFGSKEGELLVKTNLVTTGARKNHGELFIFPSCRVVTTLDGWGRNLQKSQEAGTFSSPVHYPLSQGRAVRIPWHNYPALGCEHFHSLKTVSHDSGDFFERRLQKQEEVSSLARESTRQAK